MGINQPVGRVVIKCPQAREAGWGKHVYSTVHVMYK